jgi:hypothetical protein
MEMHPVISTNVKLVGYDSNSRTLRIQFQSGGTYEYSNVTQALFDEMLKPHPWRRVGGTVKAHATKKLG